MRIFLRIALVLAVVYVALVAGLVWAMHQPPARFGQIMSKMPMPLFLVLPFRPLWMHARAGNLTVGDAAPDFALETLDRKSRIQLASFRGAKPVVLVFGSYT